MRGQAASEVGEVVGPTVALITSTKEACPRAQARSQVAGELMEVQGARWARWQKRKIYPPPSSAFDVRSAQRFHPSAVRRSGHVDK